MVTVRRDRLLGWFADRRMATKVSIIMFLMTAMAGTIGVSGLARMAAMNDDMGSMAQSNDKVARIGDVWSAMATMHELSTATAVDGDPEEKKELPSQVRRLTAQVSEAFEAYKAVAPADVTDVQDNIASFEAA
ncbi:Tar ligand binding domain-containing protein [Planomonospora corallina]|uniref:Tar ligand binding domain-containing protein n=1 Tax=Planomonospora corallina TaxID=1806052 RepID=A0ABV8I546_9ACTN